MDRRQFLHTTAAMGGLWLAHQGCAQRAGGTVIASANGLAATRRAMERLAEGADPLDAVVEGVALVEADPEDWSVGFGGLPNEEGVVQLDASVMHGPTRGAGAVAAIEGIKHPARVAQQVMENTDHVLLVGAGATRFARAMGHPVEDLLTPYARRRWLRWKSGLSDRDDWIEPEERLPEDTDPRVEAAVRHHGTINCCAVDARGDVAGVTTTSGLAFKIPGRVGDSPIIGAGLYVDNDVGACGSTGRGEANLKTCASFLVVELMRAGRSPREAGLEALERIVGNTTEPYLLDDQGRPRFNVNFFAVNKDGEAAGTAIWSGSRYALTDGGTSEVLDSAYLYERAPRPGEEG